MLLLERKVAKIAFKKAFEWILYKGKGVELNWYLMQNVIGLYFMQIIV